MPPQLLKHAWASDWVRKFSKLYVLVAHTILAICNYLWGLAVSGRDGKQQYIYISEYMPWDALAQLLSKWQSNSIRRQTMPTHLYSSQVQIFCRHRVNQLTGSHDR